LVVIGIAAQAADDPADGIGLALQGLAVAFFCGEAFLEISDGKCVVVGVLGVEAFGQLGDPAVSAWSSAPSSQREGPRGASCGGAVMGIATDIGKQD